MPFAERLTVIQSRIHAACERAGRNPSGVALMAVSKNHPPESVAEAARCGLTLFGENRVQEGRAKIPQCPGHLRWHLIGHLQSNKCRDAVAFFEMIQGVDSLALAQEINKAAEKQSKTMKILLEVNVAGESSKFGYKPDAVLADLDAINALPRLELHGLMTIAPYTSVAEQVRPFFRRLRELKAACEQQMGVPLPVLSMGMSGDFEVAIEEGSTLVRIGTALFGERQKAGREVAGE
jgi:PLP dependent protein